MKEVKIVLEIERLRLAIKEQEELYEQSLLNYRMFDNLKQIKNKIKKLKHELFQYEKIDI